MQGVSRAEAHRSLGASSIPGPTPKHPGIGSCSRTLHPASPCSPLRWPLCPGSGAGGRSCWGPLLQVGSCPRPSDSQGPGA